MSANNLNINPPDGPLPIDQLAQQADQDALKAKLALLSATHHHLASTLGAVQGAASGSTSNQGLSASNGLDPNDPNNWPYDPSQPIPNFNFNTNTTLTPDQLFLNFEQAYSWVKNNPDNINGYIALLQAMTQIAPSYQKLSPTDQASFTGAVTDLQNGSQDFAGALANLMYGVLYQNLPTGAAGPTAWDKTNSILQMIVNGCQAMADAVGQSGSSSDFFRRLAKDAAKNFTMIQYQEQNNFVPVVDTFTGKVIGYEMVGILGPTDYTSWKNNEIQKLGGFFAPANNDSFAQMQNLLYGAIIGTIEATTKDPWKQLVMVISLLINGPDQDIARQLNGTSHTMDVLSDQGKLLNKVMTLLQSGNFTGPNGPQNAQDLMSYLSQLKTNCDTNPLLAQLAPEFDNSINTFLSMNGTIPIATGATSSSPINLQPGQYSFTVPQNVTSISVMVDGKLTPIPNSSAGNTVTFNIGNATTMVMNVNSGTTSIPVPLGDLGFSGQIGGLAQFKIGDFSDLAGSLAALQSGTQGSDIATSFSSLISLLQSPNSNLQNMVGTLTNTKTTMEATLKAALQIITDVNTTILRALQNAGN